MLARRSHLTILVSLILLMVITGCSPEQPVLAPARSGVLRIVSSLPSRGSVAGQSKQISEAIQLALDDRAENGVGATVEYVQLEGGDEETGEWSRQRELANATAAVNDPSVIAYIGPYNSGAVAVSLPVTSRAGLLQASPSATWPGLTLPGWNPGEPERYYPTGNHNFIRLMPPDSVQAATAARWALKEGFKDVAVLDDGSSYSHGMAESFRSEATILKINTSDLLDARTEALSGIAAKLAGFDGVFVAPSSGSSAVLLAKSLSASGLPIFATDTALDPHFIEQASDAGREWHIMANRAPDSASSEQVAAAFTAHYGTRPGLFAANSYALTNMILDAIGAGSGRDRNTMVKFVREGRGGTKGTNKLTFNNAGDPTTWTVSGYVITNDTFSLKRTFDSAP